jgi:hypothetical protein
MQPFENCQKHFFLNSNLRKVNCVAYFVVLRREPIKWEHCIGKKLLHVILSIKNLKNEILTFLNFRYFSLHFLLQFNSDNFENKTFIDFLFGSDCTSCLFVLT